MTAGPAALADQRDQAFEDLAALAEQQARGEIDEDTAARLRAHYEAEALAVARRLDALHGHAGDRERAAGGATPGDRAAVGKPTRRGRRVAGTVLLAGAMALAVLAVPSALRDRAPGGVVSGEDVRTGTAGRDLSAVTNDEMEAVVADNPDIVPMRLRLAHRYLDDGEVEKALDHYLEVLDREPRNTEAMSHLGWITFNGGDAEVGAQLLEASLAEEPGQPEARWFLANVRLYGQGQPAEAIDILGALLAEEAVPAEDRETVEDVLAEAEAMLQEDQE